MKAVFRVDASTRIGTGHLMRSLTLAQALRARQVHTQFICREHTGNLIPLLREKNIPVTALPGPVADDNTLREDYPSWLGTTSTEDANQTVRAMQGGTPDWLIVDHYGIDIEWERQLRPHVGKLMVIDDLADRSHDCDLLLDQNYAPEGGRRHDRQVPKHCKQLTGPRYALLRPEYRGYRTALRRHSGQVRKVLVFFGGSDPHNMTEVALEALASTDLRNSEVTVIVGANNLHRERIEQRAAKASNTKVFGSLPNLADLIAQADLAVGAAGTTTWERMCLGLPSVVVSIAENQKPAADALAEAKLIRYAGHVSQVTPAILTQLLQQLTQAREDLSYMSNRGQLQVDGLGASRLVEALCPSASEEILLRRALPEDVVHYYDWARDPTVRKNAINVNAFTWESHQAWFAAKLRSADSRLFVLEVAGLPIGQIRFDTHSDAIRIDYSLDVFVRGRGWGSRLVSLGLQQLRAQERQRVSAFVKQDNHASQSVFRQLGFKLASDQTQNGLVFYID